MDWSKVLADLIYPALGTVITTVVSLLFYALCDAVKRYASTLKHGQAAGVVADAAKASWCKKVSPMILMALSDGRMTPEEWEAIMDTIRVEGKQVALDRLKDLRGFAPKDIGKWVEVTLDAKLGELIGSVNLPASDEETLANTPASDPSA
jgi:hypothetical protein